jgi:hypothetical protein
MTAADRVARIAPYFWRLLEDEYIQDQLGQAITGLRHSSRRAKGHSAREAIRDRRLRAQLRLAANSLTAAARALQQPPPPKRHRVRRALLLSAAGVAGALVWRTRSSND